MAELDLAALLQGNVRFVHGELEETAQPFAGVALGIVERTDDEENLGRIQVTFPWLSDTVPSAWAEVAQPWAGKRRGTYLLPEKGDQALVAFRHGDLRRPVVLGFLWSESAPPPVQSPQLDRRELVSRSGHTLRFDDAKQGGGLTLRSAKGHEVKLDDQDQAIHIKAAGGKVELTVDGRSGAVTIRSAANDINLDAPKGTVSITAMDIQIQAQGELKLGGQSMVRINS